MLSASYQRFFLLACAAVVGAAALTVLTGWVMRSQILVQLHPHFAPVQFNTALCLLLSAASLALGETGWRRLGAAAAGAVSLLGFFTLLQYLLNADFGIDRLFVDPFTQVGNPLPGRMPLNTSVACALSGLALTLACWGPGRNDRSAVAIALLGSAVGAIGLVALTGELTGIETASVWGKHTHMAVRSAFCFVLLSAAIIVLARQRSAGLPLWLPIPIFIGLVATTLSIMQAVSVAQDNQIRAAVQLEARLAARSIEQHIGGLYSALDRLAQRWETLGDVPRRLWDADAQGYLRDFPELRALAWVDPAGQTQWANSLDPGLDAGRLDLRATAETAATVSWAVGTRAPRVSPVQSSDGPLGANKFFYVRPVFVSGRHQGTVAALIDLPTMLKDRIASTAFEQLWLEITENGKPVFTNFSTPRRGQPGFEEQVLLTNAGRVWFLKAAPKPVLLGNLNAASPRVIAVIGLLTATLIGFTVFVLLEHEGHRQALRISEERLALAVSGTRDGLWDWDVASDRVYYSPRFKEMLGYWRDADPTTAAAFFECVHPDDRDAVIAATRAHFVCRIPYNVTFRVIRPDGRELWLNSRGEAVRDNAGRAVRMTGFISDVSHDKEIERLKSEFVSTVSHELRTPLTSIRGALALMRGGVLGALPERAKEMAEIAHRSCERLILLINDLLDLDKIESGETRFELSDQCLNRLLEDAVEANRSFGVKDDIAIVFEPLQPEGYVKVDPNRFNQVLNNLISNAMKYSPKGGTVVIEAVRHHGKLRVSVTDNGPGIPEDFQPRVFSKFAQADGSATRRLPGTGLGLNISQQIVHRLGGEIGFASAPGTGTTFWFEVPETAAPERPAPTAVPVRPDVEGVRGPILICEDDADQSRVLEELLLEEGFRCVTAHTIADARRHLAETSFQALILDLMLPDGNGVELIRSIRASQRGENLPIIVTSIKSEEGREELNGGAIGVVDWLKKEIDPVELLSALRRCTADVGSERLRILHVEDDPELRSVIAHMLRDKADVLPAGTVEEGIQRLSTDHFDMVILDMTLPDGSGLAILEALGSFQAQLPVLILSAQEMDDAVRRKVAASLVKSRITERKMAEMIAQLASSAAYPGRRAA